MVLFHNITHIIWKCWKNSQLIKKVRRKWIVEELSLLKRPDRAGQREGRRMYKGLYYWLSIQYVFSRLYFLPFPVLQTLCPFWHLGFVLLSSSYHPSQSITLLSCKLTFNHNFYKMFDTVTFFLWWHLLFFFNLLWANTLLPARMEPKLGPATGQNGAKARPLLPAPE